MIAYDLEFGPNTAEAHKKMIYGLFGPQQLLSAYRTARREHGTADLVLVCPNMDPNEIFAGTRRAMSKYLQQELKFPAPLMSAHSMVRLPKDSDAFWLVIPIRGDIPVMVVMFPSAYEQVAAGGTLIGEA
jgi:hypothetical protein